MDEYCARKRGGARFQARLPESQLLHPARRFLPRILHHRVAVAAPIFSAAGQGRESAIHDSPSQSRLREPSALRALSDVWRVRLADESELPLVLDHVRRLHFRGRGRPFDILLLRSIKKHPRQLCYVAVWILLMQMLDIYLVVLPALHGTGVHVSLWDFAALIAIGATLAFAYLRIVGKTSLFPVRDPRLVESLKLVN